MADLRSSESCDFSRRSEVSMRREGVGLRLGGAAAFDAEW
jgi:hypothetical protein